MRAATIGGFNVAAANAHPFRCGPCAFMHNCQVQSFARNRRPLMQARSDAGFASVHGTTDTGHMFALAMEYLHGHEHERSCERPAAALERAVGGLPAMLDAHAPGSHACLDPILTGGRHAATCRCSTEADYIDSLCLNHGSRFRREDGICSMVAPGASERALLVSSEPLSAGPRWQALERDQLALIDADPDMRRRPLAITRDAARASG